MVSSRWVAVASTAVVLAVGTGCGASKSESPHIATPAAVDSKALAVAAGSCASAWRGSIAGEHAFQVDNTSKQPLQVTFINATTGDIFGEVTQLDPGTTVPLDVNAPAGSYRFRCVPRRGDASVSAAARVTGDGGSASSALVPLSAEEIDTAVTVYKHGVVKGVRHLLADTNRLSRDIDHSNLASARRAWLPAHLDFASLGAAYGTFGALSDKIDGRADGLPLGVHDPKFTGFLAVERLLWSHASWAARKAAGTTLATDVRTLDRRVPHLKLIAGDLPLRAHEILENALQFELTGDTDEGSHTNLATVLANVHGTQLVIKSLTTSLNVRQPTLAQKINAGLATFARDLRATHTAHGWPSIASLSRTTNERLDADIDGLLEQLAELPGVLTLPASLALP